MDFLKSKPLPASSPPTTEEAVDKAISVQDESATTTEPTITVASGDKSPRPLSNRSLHYTKEAANAEKFSKNFKDMDYVKVPNIYWEYTTPQVLTMEYVPGIKINRIRQLDQLGVDRKRKRWDRQSSAFPNLFRQAGRVEKLAQIIEKLAIAAGSLVNLATMLHFNCLRMPATAAYILRAFFGLQVLVGVLKIKKLDQQERLITGTA
ncbi:hypothetical protein ZIOFF_022355 [Zingiber officinale]|uniref:ABC1 atypical kinase-like domain-containing protein n=1 Tax=Zingiber officinale TaxID=94328 RepID=A0A8J5H2Z9_ZINOF|nr:hypothetical protein ZIOFF_022355 [Zingiber officinale]